MADAGSNAAARAPPGGRQVGLHPAARCDACIMPDANIHQEQPYRWSRAEYDRAVEAGAFDPDARAELLEGYVLAMTPQGSRRAAGVALAGEALRSAFGAGCHVRIRLPLAAGDDSEPEPDAAVVEGRIRDHVDAHPATALLVVEVADDSVRRDRTLKQRIYGRCGIPEYWLVTLPTAVSRSTATRPRTGTAPFRCIEPVTSWPLSPAPRRRSPSTTCFRDRSAPAGNLRHWVQTVSRAGWAIIGAAGDDIPGWAAPTLMSGARPDGVKGSTGTYARGTGRRRGHPGQMGQPSEADSHHQTVMGGRRPPRRRRWA